MDGGFMVLGGSKERVDLAVLVRNSQKLSRDDFRGPHLNPACAGFYGPDKEKDCATAEPKSPLACHWQSATLSTIKRAACV